MSRSETPYNKKALASRHPSAPARRRISPLLWLGVAGVLLLVAGLAVLLRQPAQATTAPQFTGGAKLAVDQEKINFGTVPLDKPVKATFRLTNVGDQTLEIEGSPQIQVKQGC